MLNPGLKPTYLLFIRILTGLLFLAQKQARGCCAIVVGKDATADGSVMVAHSELNKPDRCFLNFHVVPAMKHEPGTIGFRLRIKKNFGY